MENMYSPDFGSIADNPRTWAYADSPEGTPTPPAVVTAEVLNYGEGGSDGGTATIRFCAFAYHEGDTPPTNTEILAIRPPAPPKPKYVEPL
jgi:hypothetical protein